MASATANNGPSADLDLQAVERIPKDTLVTLLKRKDKEAKASAAKLEKLEERYVKVVRFNKILMEDRTSFLRFCNELLPESDSAFEEAAAQETPVNLDALLKRLAVWRSVLEAAMEDRRVFHQFAELAFPGDEVVARLFDAPSLGAEAFDTLQNKLIVLEDLRSKTIESIMKERARENETLLKSKQVVEQRNEELRDQLARLTRERAQVLTQKLQGAEPECNADSKMASHSASPHANHSTQQSDNNHSKHAEEIRKLQLEATKYQQEACKIEEEAKLQESRLRSMIEDQNKEVQRLRQDLEGMREEGERQRIQARQLLDQKDETLGRLQQRNVELEQEVGSTAFIVRCAEQQAGRDAEFKAQQRHTEQLNQSLAESQRLLTMSYSQDRVLKERIRELELSRGRGHVASDYLKHVVLKYIQYTQKGDMKAQALVPVLCTLLSFTSQERHTVDQCALPQSLLLINQAVGDAAAWFRRGGASSDGGNGSGRDSHGSGCGGTVGGESGGYGGAIDGGIGNLRDALSDTAAASSTSDSVQESASPPSNIPAP